MIRYYVGAPIRISGQLPAIQGWKVVPVTTPPWLAMRPCLQSTTSLQQVNVDTMRHCTCGDAQDAASAVVGSTLNGATAEHQTFSLADARQLKSANDEYERLLGRTRTSGYAVSCTQKESTKQPSCCR